MPPKSQPSDRVLSTGGLLHHSVERRITAFMNAACEVLPNKFSPDCCIGATRLAVEILNGRYRIKVRPLACEAWVFNPQAVTWLETNGRLAQTPDEQEQWHAAGCWIVSIGDPSTPPGEKGWSGHLIAIVSDCVLIDLSLGQANHPLKGVLAHPLTALVDSNFLEPTADGSPREAHYNLANGGKVVYMARPLDQSYIPAKDWGKVARDNGLVSLLANKTRLEEKRLEELGRKQVPQKRLSFTRVVKPSDN